jgi:formylglycine-generating enzyme required for sulfatase activity
MEKRTYRWRAAHGDCGFTLVPVPGTAGRPYGFGGGPKRRPIELRPFAISTTPFTQALWMHVMGSNTIDRIEPDGPVENVSWDQITATGGFLDRINASPVLRACAGDDASLRFRLPTESEWEYAARGGPHWTDDYAFSGSNDPDEVAWYGRRFSALRRAGVRVLGWRIGWRLFGRGNQRRPTRTHDVAGKKPNQLGLYDMSGNVWEWCQDGCIDDVDAVPADGTAYQDDGPDRRLRGGCHHNWDLHCKVWWRYGIARDAHDGCIGFRVVLGSAPAR